MSRELLHLRIPQGGQDISKEVQEATENFILKNETENCDSNENLEIELFSKKGVEFSKVLSKRVDQVKRLLENGGEVDEIIIRQEQITKKFGSVKLERDNLFEKNSGKAKELLFESTWIEEIENIIDELNIKIQVYIERKKSLKDDFSKLPIDGNTSIQNTCNLAASASKTEESENNGLSEQSGENKGQTIFSSLKKVNLPIFSGEIREFNNWANAFSACIDKSSLSPEAKLLHLRKYLSGDAAKVLQGIGHTSESYELAKQRLGRRYGGERRKIAIFLEEVELFPRIRPGNALDLEKFANLLDILAINLRETDLSHELGSGILYLKLQQKLNKGLLASYHRWLHDQSCVGSVSTLHTFVLNEATFETIADETTRGFQKSDTKNVFISTKNQSQCIFCEESHGLENCPVFLEADIETRSDMIRGKGLCFACFSQGHIKRDCKRTIKCGICKKNHNTLFHREGEGKSFHGKFNPGISLRTLVVKLSYKEKELSVNALLDDGSSQSLVNADVAEYFNLEKFDHQNLSVGVLNGSCKTFPS